MENSILGFDMNLTAGLGDSLSGLGGTGAIAPARSVEEASAALQSATASVAHVAAMLEASTGKGASAASRPATLPGLGGGGGGMQGGGMMGNNGGFGNEGGKGAAMPAFRSSFVTGRPNQKGGMPMDLANAFEMPGGFNDGGGNNMGQQQQGGNFFGGGNSFGSGGGGGGGGFLFGNATDDSANGNFAASMSSSNPLANSVGSAAPATITAPARGFEPDVKVEHVLPPQTKQDNIAALRHRIEENLDTFLLQLASWRCGQRDVCRVEPSVSPERGDAGRGRRGGGGSRSRSRGGRRPEKKEAEKKVEKKKKDSRSPSRTRKKEKDNKDKGRSESRGKRRKK